MVPCQTSSHQRISIGTILLGKFNSISIIIFLSISSFTLVYPLPYLYDYFFPVIFSAPLFHVESFYNLTNSVLTMAFFQYIDTTLELVEKHYQVPFGEHRNADKSCGTGVLKSKCGPVWMPQNMLRMRNVPRVKTGRVSFYCYFVLYLFVPSVFLGDYLSTNAVVVFWGDWKTIIRHCQCISGKSLGFFSGGIV